MARGWQSIFQHLFHVTKYSEAMQKFGLMKTELCITWISCIQYDVRFSSQLFYNKLLEYGSNDNRDTEDYAMSKA